MKKILFAILLSASIFTEVAAAKAISSQKSILPVPGFYTEFRCRTWNIGINVFGANMSTSIILCCIPQGMGPMPYMSCFEYPFPTAPSGGGNIVGNVLVKDFGTEARSFFEKQKPFTSITINKSDVNEINGQKYRIKNDTYKVLETEKHEQFVQLTYELVK